MTPFLSKNGWFNSRSSSAFINRNERIWRLLLDMFCFVELIVHIISILHDHCFVWSWSKQFHDNCSCQLMNVNMVEWLQSAFLCDLRGGQRVLYYRLDLRVGGLYKGNSGVELMALFWIIWIHLYDYQFSFDASRQALSSWWIILNWLFMNSF